MRGLSPRVRGNLNDKHTTANGKRSIPACAGEPLRLIAPPFPIRVYPRVCGGTVQARQNIHAIAGLSPRVRGNPVPWLLGHGWGGSIPACAGEPDSHVSPLNHLWVYPRVCGGTVQARQNIHAIAGLSPRVRGNPVPWLLGHGWGGSIPACAGEP